MMDNKLDDLIDSFSPDSLQNYFRVKVPTFEPSNENINTKIDPEDFHGAQILGSFAKGSVGLVSVKTRLPIGERSSKKRQFTIAREIIRKNLYDAALIVFYDDASHAFRISFVRAKYDGEKRSWSNWRRYTHYVDKKKSNKTFKHQFNKCDFSSLEEITNAFSIEAVNNEFYREIAKLYDELVGTDKVRGELKHPEETELRHEFAVRLIGRIIFAWFLREKTDGTNKPLVGKGLLSRNAANESNYYHTILAPLFFEVLNTPVIKRKERFRTGGFADVPYLNGGLFTPQSDDHYQYDEGLGMSVLGTIDIPDVWLKKLFELLELYNFTVDENTTVDVDLSIDPEMLGRIFENLLARINPETGETVRKSTGSFYTPREIVEYMVDESLTQHLINTTNISEEKLRVLISYDLTDDSEHPLAEDEEQRIVDALSNITILDPACGSGAFPIGMLQKIVFILQQIDPDAKLWFEKQISGASLEVRRHLQNEFDNKNYDYLRKLGVIRKSVFGVDIQPIATEIARLRCFLTLIVDERVRDEEPNRGIEPLPNLDFKFVTANSLVHLPEANERQATLIEDKSSIKELKDLRDEYFTASISERQQLQARFQGVQMKMLRWIIDISRDRDQSRMTSALSDWDPFSHKAADWFDPEWMFGISEGFDIVIANPPYKILTKNNTDKKDLDYFLTKYDSIKHSQSKNLFTLFIEKALDLSSEKGLMAYIVPEGLFQTRSYTNSVDLLKRDGSIKFITTFTDYVFENAVIGNLVFLHQKNIEIETKHFHFDGSRSLTAVEAIADPVLQRISNLDTKNLSEVANVFKGMVVKDRNLAISEHSDYGQDTFLLGKSISKWKINKKFYSNYRDLEIVGGTKLYDKYQHIPRVLIRRTGNSLCSAYLTSPALTESTLYSLWSTDESYPNEYLLALLNSKLLTYYIRHGMVTNKQAFPQILMTDLQALPILKPGPSSLSEITEEVRKLLLLEEIPPEAEKAINSIIYELYGLNSEEISLIESQK